MLVALNVDVIVPFIEHLLGVQFLSKRYLSDQRDAVRFALAGCVDHWQCCCRAGICGDACIRAGGLPGSNLLRHCVMNEPQKIMTETVLSCRGLAKTFTQGKYAVKVLNGHRF